MIGRTAKYAALASGFLIFAAVMLYPAGALAVRAGTARSAARASEQLPSGATGTLLLHSVLLAACAGLLAVAISMPAAYVIGRVGRRMIDAFSISLVLAPLLFPAMVYAFGWQRLVRCSDELRCVWVWASWSWPVPALLIGGGWSRLGSRLYEEALITSVPARAFLHAVVPVLLPHVFVSLLVLFAFFLGDHSVPHACGLIVYATALLSVAQASASPLDTVAATVPIAMVIALALGVAVLLWHRLPRAQSTGDAGHTRAGIAARVMLPGMVTVCVGVPIFRLIRSVPLIDSIRTTVETYGWELIDSFGITFLSGLVTLFMGACLATVPRLRTAALIWALLWAAMPGALVGEAVITAYLPVPLMYDHWIMMLIGYVARFGWVGILVAWLVSEGIGCDQLQAARVDGAGPVAIAWRLALASNWVGLLCGVMVVASLCLSEVATTSLVRVPSIDPVALILIEKFHRFEDGVLVALSLLLVAAAVPGAILAGVAARIRR